MATRARDVYWDRPTGGPRPAGREAGMSERVKSLKLSRFLVLLIGLAILLGSPWTALAACCSITQANTQTGLVKAREGAAGRTFEFTVTDATQRRNLKVGQPVEANFDRNTAELPPSSKRYQISNVSSPPRAPPAGRPPARRAGPPPPPPGGGAETPPLGGGARPPPRP